MSSIFSVVIADDNRDAADSLVELLGAMGYAATAAQAGAPGLEDGARPDSVR